MGIVFSDQSIASLTEEMHKFVYFLPQGYSITVETADVEISRDVGTILARTFMKAGLGSSRELACAHVTKGRELNFPIACTFKQDATIH